MNHITHIYNSSSHVFHHNNHIQASANHPRIINNQCHTALPSSSLRLKGLVQTSPIRLGEGSKRGIVAPCGISLRRDPSRLGELLARSKKGRGSPERSFAWSSLGEPLLISPRRDMLAWARKSVPTMFSRATVQYYHQTNAISSHKLTIAYHPIKSCNIIKQSQKKHRFGKNPNFPYLEIS